MNEQTFRSLSTGNEADILFDCPNCGKSLEIDARGAGYLVICPDCKQEVEVPAWDPAGDDAEAEALQPVADIMARVEQLEKIVAHDDQLLRRIGDEVQLIQSALDRINEIIESRQG